MRALALRHLPAQVLPAQQQDDRRGRPNCAWDFYDCVAGARDFTLPALPASERPIVMCCCQPKVFTNRARRRSGVIGRALKGFTRSVHGEPSMAKDASVLV